MIDRQLLPKQCHCEPRKGRGNLKKTYTKRFPRV